MRALARVVNRLTGGPLFYGWYIVLAGGSTNVLVGGVIGFSFGVFIEPIRDEMGWTVAAITIGYSLRAFESGLMAPFTGYLVDRLGPRRMAIGGLLIVFVGMLYFASAQTLWHYYAASLVIAVGQSASGFTPFSAAVMNWFQRGRPRAMGLLFSGNAAGYMMAPVVAALIVQFGWRGTLVIAAFAILAVGLPMAFVLRDRPEPYGMHPDGIDPEDASRADERSMHVASTSGMSVGEAFRTPALYLLAAAITFGGTTQNVWIVHQVPHLQDVGFSAVHAGLAVAMYGALQIPGRFFFGYVADFFGRKRTYIACFIAQGIGLLIFANVTSERSWMLALFYPFYVFGHGLYVVLFMTLIADYFGSARFSTIRGVAMMAQMPFGVAFPIIAGMVFDRTGTYQGIFMIFGALVMVSALCVALVRRPFWAEVVARERLRITSPAGDAQPPEEPPATPPPRR
ncbi:MAG: MFS transporter [Chloroflexi bacterium]|nr:MFS transporter [Chloroflexota bacterium]